MVDRGLFWTFDPFTITAHDPNASALYPYSSVEITPALPKRVFDPYGVKYTGCSVNGNCSAITPTPGGGGTGIAYVSAAGNKWIYSVSKPPEHGKVEINQTTSTFEDGNRRCPGCKGYTYTGISTGTFTYTPNATLAESGGVAPEVGNDDIFTIRATDPNDPTIFREIDVSVDVLANNAGSVWSELFNQIEPKTNQAAIGSSIGPDPVTSKSGYVIGTGSTTPGTGIERPPPPQGDVPIVICGGPHILDPTAPPELCINPSDAHAEDRPTVTQTQTAPTSGTPSTPTSTVAAGMPVVGAATPASSIEGVPQGDVPGWRENITKDPITTDKYTVQEGDTLSGIAQRWGLGDDRTKNYQDLATPPPLKPLSSDTRTVPSTIRSKDKATTSDGGCPPRPRSPGYSPADHGDVSTLADGL